MKNVLKILGALAAIAGIIYVVATYGEKIVAWCRKVLSTICWEDECCCEDEDCCCGEECCCEEDCCTEECCEEEVQAEEADFEG